MEIWAVDHNWRLVDNIDGFRDADCDTYRVGEDNVVAIVPVASGINIFYMVKFENGNSVGLYNANKVYYREAVDRKDIQ